MLTNTNATIHKTKSSAQSIKKILIYSNLVLLLVVLGACTKSLSSNQSASAIPPNQRTLANDEIPPPLQDHGNSPSIPAIDENQKRETASSNSGNGTATPNQTNTSQGSENSSPGSASSLAAREGFVVAELAPGQIQTLQFDALGKPKKKAYNLKACIEEGLKRTRLPGAKFQLSDGVSVKELTTDNAGCMVWQESYEFDYWAPESYFQIKRYIKLTEPGFDSQTIEVSFLFNPWSDTVLFQPTNRQQVPDSFVSQTKSKLILFDGKIEPVLSEKSRLALNSIQMRYTGMDFSQFEVDRYLSLFVAHRYFISFRPWAIRKKLNDPNANENIPQGTVNLKIIFLKDRESNRDLGDFSNYITHIDEDFTIDKDYQEVKKVSFLKFPDIAALSTRMRVLVKISFKNNNSNLADGYFEGFIESLPGDDIALNKTKFNFNKIYSDFMKKIDLQKSSEGPVQLLSSRARIRPLSNSNLYKDSKKNYGNFVCGNFNSSKINLSLIERSMTYGMNSLSICETLALKNELKMNFSKYYPQFGYRSLDFNSIGTYYLVDKIVDKNPKLLDSSKISVPGELSMSVSLNESVSKNTDVKATANANMNVNAGLNLDLLGLSGIGLPAAAGAKGLGASAGIGLGVRAGVEGNWSYGWAANSNNSTNYSKRISLESRGRKFAIQAMVRKCFIAVFLLPTDKRNPAAWLTKPQNKPVGVSFCSNVIEKKTLTESYYYITDTLARVDAWSDGKSVDQKLMVMFVRGNSKYDMLREMFENKDITFDLFSFGLKDDGKKLPPAVYERVTQVFPGLSSGGVSFIKKP